MWVLKLKLNAETFFFGKIAIKYNIDLIGYNLSYHKEKKYLLVTSAGFMIGSEKNKKAAIKGIKSMKEVINIEINNDFIVVATKQPLYTEPVYDRRLIWPKPLFISHEGYHLWEIANWKKEPLLKIVKFGKQHHGARLLKLKEEKLKNISFTTILSEVTKKQKRALELAITEGYYTYPKKTNVHRLAKLMKVSYSTFQEHLRKAEAKMIPLLSRRY